MKLKVKALDGTLHEIFVESLASVSIMVETKDADTHATSIVYVPLVSHNHNHVAWVADQMGFDTDTCEGGEDGEHQVIIYTGVIVDDDDGTPGDEDDDGE